MTPRLMSDSRRLWLILGAFVILLAVILAWPSSTGKCLTRNDRVVHVDLSPDGMKVACTVERHTGSVKPMEYFVMVLPGDKQPPVAVEEDRRGSPRTEWENEKTLRVTVTEPETFTGVENQCDDVKVAYSHAVH